MDSVVEKVGPIGRAQRIYALLIGAVSILSSLLLYCSVFFMAVPSFTCTRSIVHDSIDGNPNVTIESFSNNCTIWKEFIRDRNSTDFFCEFKDQYYNLTAVNDWHLICDKEYLPSNFLRFI